MNSKKYNHNYEKNQSQLLSTEDFNNLLNEIKEIDTRIKTSQDKLNQNEILKKQITQYNEEKSKKIEFEKAFNNYENKLEEFNKTNKIKIEKHKELLPYDSELNDWFSTERQLKNENTKKERIEKNVDIAKDKFKLSIDSISEFTDVKSDEETAIENLSAFSDKYNELQTKLDNKSNDYSNQIELIKNIEYKNFPIDDFQKKHDITLIDDLIDNIQKTQEELHQYLMDNNLESNEVAIEELYSTKEKISKYHNEQNNVNRLQKVISEIENEINAKTTESTIIPDKTKELQNELEKNELLLDKLKAELELKKLRAKYEDDRKNLKPKEACPLCGSVDHPYVLDYPDTETNKEKNEIRKCEKDIKNQNQEIASYNQDLKNINKRLQELSKEKNKTDKEIHNSKGKIEDLKKQIDEKYIVLQQDEANKQIDKNNKIIRDYIQSETKLNSIIKIKTYAEKSIEVNDEINKLSNEINKLYSGNDFKKDHNNLKTDFTNAEKNLQKAQNEYNNWKQRIDNLKDEIDDLSKKLKPEIAKLNYDSIEVAHKNLLKSSEYEQLNETKNNINNELDKLKSSLNLVNVRLSELKPDKEISENDLKEEQKSLNLNLKEAEKLRDNKKSEETIYLKLKEENKKLDIEIKSLKPVFEKWKLLSDLIGDATGNKFRNYAQQLTLRHLIIYANKRMNQLSGRYVLKFPNAEDKELSVIDTDMGDAERVAKTLSGGETFLISLSLALALSDLASKNVRIESLFIDEGFGALDQETLDKTLDTLERLQSQSNKTIGIISHIEALKERITTQINVKRNGQGYSKLEILDCI